jgi:hypothetical protein
MLASSTTTSPPTSYPTISQNTTIPAPSSSHNLPAIIVPSIIGGILLIALIIICCSRRVHTYIRRRWIGNPRLSGNDAEGVTVADPNGSDPARDTYLACSSSDPLENSLHQSSPSGEKLVGETMMQAGVRSTTVKDYTVGWICALPLEMSAAIATFDETHPKLRQRLTDHNTYGLGRIGDHNVVVACLGAGVVGSASAAVVASQMNSTYESIRFCLMVGVGGGAPSSHHDIRLGDIVVSNPAGKFGGVVQ